MSRDKTIKIRANEYEKAIVSALVEQANSMNPLTVLTESDIVRIALNDMATKYLTMDQRQQLKKQFNLV